MPGRVGRAFFAALGLALAGGQLASSSTLAQAAQSTRVVSAGDDDNPYDFNLSLFFLRESRKGNLMRETTAPTGNAVRVPDQVFQQDRNTLNLRMDVGLLPDIGLYVNLPLVISDTRTLSFDQSGACPGAQCSDANTSPLLRDQFLPGFAQSNYGLDAIHGRSFVSPSSQTFAGPKRQGLAYLGFGLNWAMFNQKRVPSEPTWLVGFEARVDVSKTMRFDPQAPKANTAVGLGYHQLLVNTMASRRFGALEPYIGGWYMFPIKSAGSPFEKQAMGSKNAFSDPQHRSFVTAGVEATVWEKPDAHQRISIELRLSMETRFMGLARSDLWEPLSGSSTCAAVLASGCRPGLDDRDLDGDGKADPNTGITRSPTYGIFGGDLGLNVQAGEHVRFRGLFGLTAEQNHFMTDARSGYASYDSPGRRYYVQDAFGYQFLLDGALLF